jgi:hypothetical protein
VPGGAGEVAELARQALLAGLREHVALAFVGELVAM